MIRGVGIDSVEIERFKEWHTYSQKSLLRIFSEEEIMYCLEFPAKSAERFAARFAVREALLKALHQAMPTLKIPLLTLCKAIKIDKASNGAPDITIDWQSLHAQPINCSLSWTHTKTTATAIVVVNNLRAN